jgi:3-hydroxyacyl-CoA dehydrogenase
MGWPRLKKVGVLAGNCRGFIGNRMFHPYVREANFLVEEGATPQEIDAVLYEWGMAMGPLAVVDLAGLDVGYRIRQEFKHTEVEGVRYPFASDILVEAGRLGKKTRAGFYKYDENRVASPDPGADRLIRDAARAAGIPQRAITREEILERILYALINEGARSMEEGIAIRRWTSTSLYKRLRLPGVARRTDEVCRLGRTRQSRRAHRAWHRPPRSYRRLRRSSAWREGKTFADYDASK